MTLWHNHSNTDALCCAPGNTYEYVRANYPASRISSAIGILDVRTYATLPVCHHLYYFFIARRQSDREEPSSRGAIAMHCRMKSGRRACRVMQAVKHARGSRHAAKFLASADLRCICVDRGRRKCIVVMCEEHIHLKSSRKWLSRRGDPAWSWTEAR